ncbi:MAG: PorT family protein [Candidatus Aminicenantes bacterium]|nr:PorT family protein [Candidatus Aminicenantes bacterium]
MNSIVSIVLLIFSSLVLSYPALSAPQADKSFFLGVKAGYNQGQLRGQKTEPGFEVENMSLGCFSAGIMANWRINNHLSIQPEILYFQKGGQYEVVVPINLPGIEIKVNDSRYLNYLEIPFLFKISFPVSARVSPTFLIGPSMGINLTARVKSKIRITVPNFQFTLIEKKDIRNEANDLEWSFLIGGGLDFNLRKGRLVIDQRFFFGLTANRYEVLVPASQFAPLGFPMAQDMIYELKMNNYLFSISLGYLF